MPASRTIKMVIRSSQHQESQKSWRELSPVVEQRGKLKKTVSFVPGRWADDPWSFWFGLNMRQIHLAKIEGVFDLTDGEKRTCDCIVFLCRIVLKRTSMSKFERMSKFEKVSLGKRGSGYDVMRSQVKFFPKEGGKYIYNIYITIKSGQESKWNGKGGRKGEGKRGREGGSVREGGREGEERGGEGGGRRGTEGRIEIQKRSNMLYRMFKPCLCVLTSMLLQSYISFLELELNVPSGAKALSDLSVSCEMEGCQFLSKLLWVSEKKVARVLQFLTQISLKLLKWQHHNKWGHCGQEKAGLCFNQINYHRSDKLPYLSSKAFQSSSNSATWSTVCD